MPARKRAQCGVTSGCAPDTNACATKRLRPHVSPYVRSYTQLSGKRPRVQPTDGAPVDYVSKQVLVKRTGRRPASRARRGSESKRVDGPPQSDLGKRAKSKEAAARAATEERAAARQAGFDIALAALDAACCEAGSGPDSAASAQDVATAAIHQVSKLFPEWHCYVGLLEPRAEVLRCVLCLPRLACTLFTALWTPQVCCRVRR